MISVEQAIYAAYSTGRLKYKLYKHQYPVYDKLKMAIRDPKCLKYTLNCSRRFGKTTILCIIALETCLIKPFQQVRYAAPTNKSLVKSILPIMRMLLTDCPEQFKPKFSKQDGVFVFPNGSELHLAGTDNGHYESLRGTASHLNIMDECGFMDECQYILTSVLMPQTLTTGGVTILSSTPPRTPAHDFYLIAKECEELGYYSKFTIYDNKSLTTDLIEKYAKEAGGFDSSTFLREYLCQFCTDENTVIIPEFDKKYIISIPEFEKMKQNNPYYVYFHKYTSMDLGVKDFTALLYGYYDFNEAVLYIEDEKHLNGPKLTTEILANDIREAEQRLWNIDYTKQSNVNNHTSYNSTSYNTIVRRISDNNNLMLIQDLSLLHNLSFSPTNKDTLEAMVNEVRIMMNSGKIKINEKCTQLIGCLQNGVWDIKGKMFARSQKYGHYDHLAALIYLVRNLDKYTNPIPETLGKTIQTHYMYNIPNSNLQEMASKMFPMMSKTYK